MWKKILGVIRRLLNEKMYSQKTIQQLGPQGCHVTLESNSPQQQLFSHKFICQGWENSNHWLEGHCWKHKPSPCWAVEKRNFPDAHIPHLVPDYLLTASSEAAGTCSLKEALTLHNQFLPPHQDFWSARPHMEHLRRNQATLLSSNYLHQSAINSPHFSQSVTYP